MQLRKQPLQQRSKHCVTQQSDPVIINAATPEELKEATPAALID
jgi:hypothetical protein